LLWSVLAFRIGVALVRAESREDGLALPMVALFVTSALVASRAWRMFQQHEDVSHPPLKKD
jgi:hypothetical protein